MSRLVVGRRTQAEGYAMLRWFWLSVVAMLWAATAVAGDLTIEVLDVGQADAILIRTEDKAVLIDAGEKKEMVRGLLEARGIKRLDLVVATHAHADHIGGMEAVVRGFDVGLYLDNGLPHTSSTYERLMTAVEELELRYLTAKTGQSFKLGSEAVFEVLLPGEQPITGSRSDINSNSVVMRLTHGKNCFLFTGDAEEPTEMAVVAQKPGTCQVLKVAHHGGNHSSVGAFLDAIQPKVAIISVGTPNRYGHPGQETLDRLAARNITIYRTDLSGTVTIHSDGKSMEIMESSDKAVPVGAVMIGGTKGKGRGAMPHANEDGSVAARVNINSASVSELTKLSGVGKVTAERIVAHREENGPFASVDDLTKVKGVGAKTLDKFRDQVEVGPAGGAGGGSRVVETAGGGSGASFQQAQAPTVDGKIDLNTASVSELTKLPGVGKVTAERIVAHREENGPFKSVDALTQVKGVGAKTLDKFRDQVTVGSGAAGAEGAGRPPVETPSPRGEEKTKPAPTPAVASGLIDINTATAAELTALPGVGKVTAERIVAHREENGPFKSVDALTQVKGVGAKTLDKFRDKVGVGVAAAAGDGPAVVSPAPVPEAAPVSPAGGKGSGVNINTATAAELTALPGVGKVTAERIVADREEQGPFKTCQELTRVKGIGPKTLEKFVHLCTTE